MDDYGEAKLNFVHGTGSSKTDIVLALLLLMCGQFLNQAILGFLT
jgi:hypothetical protein